MSARKIKIRLKGAEKDKEHIRLNEFITQLETLYVALNRTDHLISQKERPSVIYRVIDLSHSSPATITLEAMVNVDRNIGDLAHEIRNHYKAQDKKLTSPDSIHLASAITYGVNQFHTFDDPLLRLTGNIAGYPLVICKPQGTQTVLF